jgi:AAA domain
VSERVRPGPVMNLIRRRAAAHKPKLPIDQEPGGTGTWVSHCPNHNGARTGPVIRWDQHPDGTVSVHPHRDGDQLVCAVGPILLSLGIDDPRIRPYRNSAQPGPSDPGTDPYAIYTKLRQALRDGGYVWSETRARGGSDRFGCPACGAKGDGHGLHVTYTPNPAPGQRHIRLYCHDRDCPEQEILEPLGITVAELRSGDDVDDLGDDPQGIRLFRRYSAAALAQEPDDFAWQIEGMLAQPTYGPIAGEMKTLKTYVGQIIVVGLAAGLPVFGHFRVPHQRPVSAYVGEGGRLPWKRRLRRIAQAYGVDLADLPIEATFDVAAISSERFRRSLARDLEEIQPGLVWLDPYYAYHGTDAKASNLHDEGNLLTKLSSWCLDSNANLLINNHYNQTGSGPGLKRITQTGMGEWADTWLLLSHRQPPDVEGGRFWLDLTIGSRQWGGRDYALDLNIGRFDPGLGEHDGDIIWNLQPVTTAQRDDAQQALSDWALAILEEHPWTHTKAGLATELGGNRKEALEAINTLVKDGRIRSENLARAEGTRSVRRDLFALATEPVPESQNRLEQVDAP